MGDVNKRRLRAGRLPDFCGRAVLPAVPGRVGTGSVADRASENWLAFETRQVHHDSQGVRFSKGLP